MNLHDCAEFERQLMRYVAALHTPREHNERCDLVQWVQRYVTRRCEATAAEVARVVGPIADTSGGP